MSYGKPVKDPNGWCEKSPNRLHKWITGRGPQKVITYCDYCMGILKK